jgi:hypothetical protein
MDLSQLKISAPSGHGRGEGTGVELDGKPIGRLLRGIDLHLDVDDFTTATLHVLRVGVEFDGKASVVLDEDTQVMLKQLGWTPPADD